MDNFIPLDSIHIASPCSADWDAMHGDSRARFCDTCAKHVYNLSDMSRAQAQALVSEKEGKLCVQFYQRADGTMLTDDCPVPLRPVRNGARHIWRAASAAVLAFAALCSGWLARDAGAGPKRATAHMSKKTKPHTALKHVAKKTAPPIFRTAGTPVARPVALTGIVAPPTANATPPAPVTIVHPDAAPVSAAPPAPQTQNSNDDPSPMVRGRPAPQAQNSNDDPAPMIRGKVAYKGKVAIISPKPAPTPEPAATPEPTATPQPTAIPPRLIRGDMASSIQHP